MRKIGALFVAALLAAALGACSCEEPTDEERLREQLDVTKVHMYVAAKFAIAGTDQEARAAREQLLRAFVAGAALAAGEDRGAALAAMEGGGLATTEGTEIDVIALARGLLDLRRRGRDEVRRWGDEEAPLILTLLPAHPSAAGGESEPIQALDRDSEHALILLAGFIAKIHPRVPVPVPIELLLYEAYVTDVDAVEIAGLAPLIRGVRAYIYATNTFCDLAAADGRELDVLSTPEAQSALGDAIGTVGVETDAESEAALAAALSVLAHGTTAVCYLDRDEQERFDEELSALCDQAERIGVPPAELAMVRAYLALRHDDTAEARRQLQLARTRERITDEERADIDRLLGYLEREDRGLLDDYFDRAFFATWALHYAMARMEEAGLLEGIRATPEYRSVMGFLVGITATLQAGQRAIPSLSDVREGSRGVLESLFE